jgi:hypothetical protein
MALNPNFTATQLLGLPNIIVLTDTSSGSDVDVTSRRAYLRDAYDNPIVPVGTTTAFIPWAIGDPSINLDVLTKDMALYVKVEWLNASNVVLYTKEVLYGFKGFNEDFAYQLTGFLANNYKRTADSGYLQNLFLLRTFIDSGNQAIELGGDIAKAQTLYDNATDIRIKSQYIFNTN